MMRNLCSIRGGHAALIVVLVLLAVTVISVAVALLLGGSDPTQRDLIYLPDDPVLLAHIDMRQIVASDLYAHLKKEIPDLEDSLKRELGLVPGDLESVTVAGWSLVQEREVSVLRTTRPVKAEDLRAGKSLAGSETEKEGERTLHIGGKQSFCLIDSQTVIIGEAAELKKILRRNGPAKLPAVMTQVMSDVGMGGALTMAVDLEGLTVAVDHEKLMAQARRNAPVDPDGGGADGIAPPKASPLPRELRGLEEFLGDGKYKAAALSIEADRMLSASAVVLCKDAAVAEELRKLADGLATMGRMAVESEAKKEQQEEKKASLAAIIAALDTLKVSASGSQVSASIRGDAVEVMVKPVRDARAAAKRVQSASNLRQLGIGIMAYAADNAGNMPPDLGLTWPYVQNMSVYMSPAHDTKLPEVAQVQDNKARAEWINRHSSFVYISRGRIHRMQRPSTTIVLFERLLSPSQKGINACYGDSHVEWLELEKADAQLKEQTGKTLEEWSRIELPGAGAKELPQPAGAPK